MKQQRLSLITADFQEASSHQFDSHKDMNLAKETRGHESWSFFIQASDANAAQSTCETLSRESIKPGLDEQNC